MRVIDGNGNGSDKANGRDHDDPGAIVDEAVFAVEGDDFEAGQMAALAADFMTGGAGADGLARLEEEGLLRPANGDLLGIKPVSPKAGTRPPSELVSEGREE